MVYTEVKEVNQNKYYYRVKSVRQCKNVAKKRVYLGANLTKEQLSKKEREADKELRILNSLLSDKEIKELNRIKQDYLNQPNANFESRYEAFCSLFTYDSAAIEGNTLSLQQTSELLFEHRAPAYKSMREINEITNHKEAFDFMLNSKEDVSKKLILNLHKLVTKNTLRPELGNQIGKYRNVLVHIRGVRFMPPHPGDVPKEMKTLLTWYSVNKTKLHPLILAAYFHCAFEMIHPFVDGNGRVGRLLMNFILHKNSYPMINIPNARKSRYYSALQEAQFNLDLRAFVEFLIELTKEEKVRF